MYQFLSFPLPIGVPDGGQGGPVGARMPKNSTEVLNLFYLQVLKFCCWTAGLVGGWTGE